MIDGNIEKWFRNRETVENRGLQRDLLRFVLEEHVKNEDAAQESKGRSAILVRRDLDERYNEG
jgi:hypothetical protein